MLTWSPACKTTAFTELQVFYPPGTWHVIAVAIVLLITVNVRVLPAWVLLANVTVKPDNVAVAFTVRIRRRCPRRGSAI